MTLLRFPRLDPIVAEGTCELWSYIWLRDFAASSGTGAGEARMRVGRLLKNVDPVYGEGLRRAMASFEQLGLDLDGGQGGQGEQGEQGGQGEQRRGGGLPFFMREVRRRRCF